MSNIFLRVLLTSFALTSLGASQTAVTTSGGTTNSVPLFSGVSTLKSSNISQSGSNIGIGTTAPASLFSVGAGSPFQIDSSGNLFQLNPTAATSSANYNSPTLNFQGNFLNGTASAPDRWSIQSTLDSSTSPTSNLIFTHSGSLGGANGPGVKFNAPIYAGNSVTGAGFQNVTAVNTTIDFYPTINTAFTSQVFGSVNLVNLQLLGSGAHTNGFFGAQLNQVKQINGGGSMASAYVQDNIFEIDAGSTPYGSVTVNQSSLALSGASGNIGSLSLFGGQMNTLPGTYTGIITNLYGLYLPNIAGATNSYAIYSLGGKSYFAGNVGIGTANPVSLLSVGSSSQFQVGSTGAVSAPTVSVSGTVTAAAFSGSGSGLTGIPYSAITGAPAAGGVTSFNGRTGAITPATNDYTVGQINGAAPLSNPVFTGNVAIGGGTAGDVVLNRSDSAGPFLGSYNSVPLRLGIGYAEKMRIDSNGSVGIGTSSPGAQLEVAGTGIRLSTGKGGAITFQDNSVQSVAWTGILPGGDYAESVDVGGDRAQYEPGDVLVIDPSAEGKFLKSTSPYSTAVMGVYSTRPGVIGRRQKSDKSHMKEEVPMAMVGVVPTKASAEGGPIVPGDLLVTSSTPGYAMKGTDRDLLIGAIIGKALGRLDAGTGLIEAAVALQ